MPWCGNCDGEGEIKQGESEYEVCTRCAGSGQGRTLQEECSDGIWYVHHHIKIKMQIQKKLRSTLLFPRRPSKFCWPGSKHPGTTGHHRLEGRPGCGVGRREPTKRQRAERPSVCPPYPLVELKLVTGWRIAVGKCCRYYWFVWKCARGSCYVQITKSRRSSNRIFFRMGTGVRWQQPSITSLLLHFGDVSKKFDTWTRLWSYVDGNRSHSVAITHLATVRSERPCTWSRLITSRPCGESGGRACRVPKVKKNGTNRLQIAHYQQLRFPRVQRYTGLPVSLDFCLMHRVTRARPEWRRVELGWNWAASIA